MVRARERESETFIRRRYTCQLREAFGVFALGIFEQNAELVHTIGLAPALSLGGRYAKAQCSGIRP
jgi:hypothetical protein